MFDSSDLAVSSVLGAQIYCFNWREPDVPHHGSTLAHPTLAMICPMPALLRSSSSAPPMRVECPLILLARLFRNPACFASFLKIRQTCPLLSLLFTLVPFTPRKRLSSLSFAALSQFSMARLHSLLRRIGILNLAC